MRQLEIMSCKLQADRGMVFRTILNIGVSLEQVLDIYIKYVSNFIIYCWTALFMYAKFNIFSRKS